MAANDQEQVPHNVVEEAQALLNPEAPAPPLQVTCYLNPFPLEFCYWLELEFFQLPRTCRRFALS